VTQLRLLVTPGGKHPPEKWAELAADEIVMISEQAPKTLVQEARAFRDKLVERFTHHHKVMMEHEQEQIAAGHHDLDLPYETESYAEKVRDEICDKLAKGTSFAEHFMQNHVKTWVEGICNKYFKSAKMVERQHFHSEKKPAAINRKKK
jgi:hypothetical protein